MGSWSMGQIGSEGLGFPLSAVEVRLVREAKERVQWDRAMDEGHYLGFRGMFGEGIRHVAVGPDGEWLALLGWCTGAFKVGARDRWIGWTREQQFRGFRPDRVTGAVGSAFVGGHGGAIRASGVVGGDVCRPIALCGDLLSGGGARLLQSDNRTPNPTLTSQYAPYPRRRRPGRAGPRRARLHHRALFTGR